MGIIKQSRQSMTETTPELVATSQKRRYPLVAFVVAFGAPGLGQLYNGQIKKALFFFGMDVFGPLLLFTPVYANFYLTFVVVVLFGGASILSFIDCVITAARIKRVQVNFYQRWYTLAAIAVLWWIFVPGVHDLKPILPYESFRIPTGSMQPTIEYGDCIIVDKRYYSHHPITPGDLAIFYYPNDSSIFISRCLAVGGDTVEIHDRVPYVNGNAVAVPGYSLGTWQPITPRDITQYSIFPKGAGNADNYGPVTVPMGKCFMLSDNISNALDSRFKGFVDVRRIIGEPLYVYWSSHLSRIGKELK